MNERAHLQIWMLYDGDGWHRGTYFAKPADGCFEKEYPGSFVVEFCQSSRLQSVEKELRSRPLGWSHLCPIAHEVRACAFCERDEALRRLDSCTWHLISERKPTVEGRYLVAERVHGAWCEARARWHNDAPGLWAHVEAWLGPLPTIDVDTAVEKREPLEEVFASGGAPPGNDTITTVSKSPCPYCGGDDRTKCPCDGIF